MLQNNGKAFGYIRNHVSSRTEVNELNIPVVTKENIIRRNITVQGFRTVHNHQCFRSTLGNVQNFPNRNSLVVLQPVVLHIHPGKVFHDEICSIVLVEELVHADDVGIAVESGNQLGFLVELLSTVFEVFGCFAFVCSNCSFSGIAVSQ